ncbi:putative conjugative transfer protein TraB [Orientia tsutsugamushi str. UT144]|uniref:Putative conjugative transfer protein TraB n=1 Tax=Orientia tsutsugamushi str. UT144 TaxID=1441384 RepID=A0A0F3RKD2_ORITS|nr:hypothetical protein [Orientia tsutsugamushi]KJW06511.1 putative conjugative transfer protein TraB [Orientia tsutsugamushi str. UT144]
MQQDNSDNDNTKEEDLELNDKQRLNLLLGGLIASIRISKYYSPKASDCLNFYKHNNNGCFIFFI